MWRIEPGKVPALYSESDGWKYLRIWGMGIASDVVCDFRSADVAAGGEGAPLAPVYHAAISAGLERPLMVPPLVSA